MRANRDEVSLAMLYRKKIVKRRRKRFAHPAGIGPRPRSSGRAECGAEAENCETKKQIPACVRDGIHNRWLVLLHGARIYLLSQISDELIERARTQVAFSAMPHRHSAGVGFFSAEDQHVGNFLELRVADFGLQFFVAIVQVNAEAGVFDL